MKKYRKAGILDLLDLVVEIEAGHWVFYKGRPLHPNFIFNMTFSTILGGIRGGLFAIAKERLRDNRSADALQGDARPGAG